MKLMIVDDNADVRRRIRSLISTSADTVFECSTGEEAVKVVQTETPDLVTMDLSLPKMSGIETIRFIRRIRPAVPCIIVSSYEKEFLRDVAAEVGAVTYVPKQALSELYEVVQTFRSGTSPYLSKTVSKAFPAEVTSIPSANKLK